MSATIDVLSMAIELCQGDRDDLLISKMGPSFAGKGQVAKASLAAGNHSVNHAFINCGPSCNLILMAVLTQNVAKKGVDR